ncbi:tyrosine-type recombinase/integrase [Verrucomicrobiota bacterium]
MDIPFQQTIERYLRRWRPTLRPSTMVNKRGLLNRFTAYLSEHHPDVQSFSQLQRYPHIEGWLEYIMYMKPTSRNASIRTLKLFFEDLIHWQWPEAPPPGLLDDQDLGPEEIYLPRPLPSDIDQAVQKACIEASTFAAMALLLLRYTGMRVGEMRALPLNAMEATGPDSFTLRVPIGKTYSERLIPLDARTVDLVQRIIAQRGCRKKRGVPARFSHYMMVNHLGRHVAQQNYSFNLRQLTAHINTTEHIYCHRLRHTFATEMARAGMPVPALMKLLGHKTPKMTMRYVEVAQTDVRKAYDDALVQLRAIHTLQVRALPPHSSLPQQPDALQPLALMAATIAVLESMRRDTQDPGRVRQLHRFIKRLRGAGYDLKDIL